MTDIARLRELAEKATPGKWEWRKWGPYPNTVDLYSSARNPPLMRQVLRGDSWVDLSSRAAYHMEQTQAEADAEYLVAVQPKNILALLTELETLRASVGEMRKALEWATPLAELAIESHRLVRLKAGHSDICGTRKDGTKVVGIWQNEIDNIETARSLLAQTDKDQT